TMAPWERDWEKLKPDVAEENYQALLHAAPNMTRDVILAERVKSPVDIEHLNEHMWHVTIHGGDRGYANDGLRRPAPGWAQDWLPAWVDNGDMHAELAREAEEGGRILTAGQAWVRAALSYHFAKFVWMVDMSRYEDAQDRAIAAIGQAHRLLDPSAERIEIPLDGFTMAGNLRKPPGVAKPPLVLLLAGLDSTKEEFFHWEQVFLDRGLATFSFDGPGQGE